MIEEHLKGLLESNNEEIHYLEGQMNDLREKLHYAKKWMEDIKKDHSLEKSIFSPRSQQNFSLDTVENAQERLNLIQNKIADVHKQMTLALKRKKEIEALLLNVETTETTETAEIAESVQKIQSAEAYMPEAKNQNGEGSVQADRCMDDMGVYKEKNVKNENRNTVKEGSRQKNAKSEENAEIISGKVHLDSENIDVSGIQKSISIVLEGSMKARFLEMLTDLHKRSEICGAFMNGNRNGKQHLREMTKTIKKYAEEIEKY